MPNPQAAVSLDPARGLMHETVRIKFLDEREETSTGTSVQLPCPSHDPIRDDLG